MSYVSIFSMEFLIPIFISIHIAEIGNNSDKSTSNKNNIKIRKQVHWYPNIVICHCIKIALDSRPLCYANFTLLFNPIHGHAFT
jgi:hypothetical protein